MLSNLRTFGAKPLLGVAIQCGAVRLQSACVTEMLLGIVKDVQYPNASLGDSSDSSESSDYSDDSSDSSEFPHIDLQSKASKKAQELLGYQLDQKVKEKLHEAIGLLLFWALYQGRYHAKIESKMLQKIKIIMNDV